MFVKELFEARKPGKDVSYSFKETKGKVERVIATLTANKSGVFTKLAARYKEVDVQLKELSLERDIMNAELKRDLADYFDAEDAVLTRVVETVSLSATLAKQSEPKEETDDTAVVLKLLEEAPPELAARIKELRTLFTSMKKAKSPALSVDYPGKAEKEAEIKLKKKQAKLDEATGLEIAAAFAAGTVAYRALKDIAKALFRKMNVWGNKYDKKLAKIKAMLAK